LGNTCLSTPLPEPKTFFLEYTIPDSGQIQFAFTGQVISYAPPCPNPPHGAMLLVGFAGIGAIAYLTAAKATLLAAAIAMFLPSSFAPASGVWCPTGFASPPGRRVKEFLRISITLAAAGT
jgi:hypothetical protein